jgi:hypothetical protein
MTEWFDETHYFKTTGQLFPKGLEIGTNEDGHYWDVYNSVLIEKFQQNVTWTTREIDEEVFRLMFGVGQAQADLLYRVNEHAQGRGHLLGKPTYWKGL